MQQLQVSCGKGVGGHSAKIGLAVVISDKLATPLASTELPVNSYLGRVRRFSSLLNLCVDMTTAHCSPSLQIAQLLLAGTPYEAHAILGEGTFGLVVLARDTRINTFRAVKLVARNRQYVHQLRREVKLHWSMNHPHIVRLREVFRAGSSHVGIAMDVCTGGSLLSYLEAHGSSHACSSAQQGPGAGGGGLREAVARWFFQQLVLTLDYCHAKEVVHRDIKLENVLLDLVPGAPLPLVRLADFGLSRRHNAATPCETYVGTPAYLAPELLQLWMEHGSLALAEQGAVHYDGTKVDVWALGVLLYTLLFKCYPFGCLSSGDLEQAALGAPGAGALGSSTQQASVRRLLAAQVEYPSPPIAGGHPVSAQCMAVLGCMLQRDPDSRPSLAEIMTTPWFREALPQGALEMTHALLTQEQQLITAHAGSLPQKQPLDEVMDMITNQQTNNSHQAVTPGVH